MTYRGEEYDFGDPNQFIENPEQRTPCIVTCDVSQSMSGGDSRWITPGLQALINSTIEKPILPIGPFDLSTLPIVRL